MLRTETCRSMKTKLLALDKAGGNRVAPEFRAGGRYKHKGLAIVDILQMVPEW